MERIKIFDTELPVKDYYCTDSPTNIKKTRPTLRLYIKLTDQCFAHCKFCSNEQSKDFGTIDLEKLAFVIRYLKGKDILHGISITGGEPMTKPDELFQLLDLIYAIDNDMEVAISTNGYNCREFKNYDKVNQLESIHISRHHYNDKRNKEIFCSSHIATTEDIIELQGNLEDKKIININTMIMRSGINSLSEIKKMLTYVGDIGVYKTGFVSLMRCNPYSESEFINFNTLFAHLDKDFFSGHHFYSKDYCECIDGIYLTEHNQLVEYYARMVKECNCPYTTQLVYTSDNKLTAGFGKKVLWK
jgi:radical SAM superfamily